MDTRAPLETLGAAATAAGLDVGVTIDRSSDFDFEQTILRIQTGGRVFGRYTLRRELGRGGMGIVWLARDETLETDVALKFLPDNVARDPEAVVSLKRETLRSRELRHPGIVGVYEFAQDNRSAAIVMEYIDGLTLSELKTKQPGGCFEVEEIAPWIEELCRVLAYAHDHARVVHRDLKPRNLMLTKKNQLKVADFGIARSVSDSMSMVSNRGHSSGTPPYMSPQQDLGEQPSPSDDIYALGATVYDLLTSRPPFYTGNISRQIHEKPVPSMTARRVALGIEGKATIPETWERLVATCLAKRAEDRPRTAAECIQWLEGNAPALGSGKASRQESKSRGSRRLIVAGLAATIVVICSGIAGWAILQDRTSVVAASPGVEAARAFPSPQLQETRTTPELPAHSPESAASADHREVAAIEPNPSAPPPVEEAAPIDLSPKQEQPTPAAVAASSPVASVSPKPQKTTASKSARASRPTTQSASPMRKAIEKQYREGNLSREQYQKAINGL